MGTKHRPGTLDHLRFWAEQRTLDTGDPWELEPFQQDIAADLLARAGDGPRFSELWVVIPEGNGKTTLFGGLALYHGDSEGWNVQSPMVPIAASSREQAEIMYRQAEGFVLRDEHGMGDRFKCQEGYRRIKCLETGGRIQVYAADDKTADGVIPTLALVDELHRHKNLKLYRTWHGKLAKRGGQIATISTAGEPNSEFEETRARILRDVGMHKSGKSHIRGVGEKIVIHDFGLRDRKQADDMKAVAAANPRKAITAETLREKRQTPTLTDEHWLRFVCNIATRTEGQAFTEEVWDALGEDGLQPKPGNFTVGFLDLGWKIDTTAMGMFTWEGVTRRLVYDVLILEPPAKGMIDEADIVDGLVERQKRWAPDTWVYDPNAGGQQMVQLLMKGEHPRQGDVEFPDFTEHSQDNSPMALAAVRMHEAVRKAWIVHDCNPGLKRHALNVVRKSLGFGGGEKWKYDRPDEAKGERRKKFPIDAFTGLLMANSVAVGEHDETPNDLEETEQREAPGEPVVKRGDLNLRGDRYVDREDRTYAGGPRRGR